MKNKITFKNIQETEGQYLLLKAESLLKEPEYTHYKFHSQYIEAVMQYYNSVFETFLESLSLSLGVNSKKIKKSYSIDVDFLKNIDSKTDEEKWFFKNLIAKIGKGLKSIYEKFKINKGNEIKPFKLFSKFVYNHKTKEILTNKEVKDISDGVVKFLKKYIGSMDDEIIVRTMLMGKFAEKMRREGKTQKEILTTSYDDFAKEFDYEVPSSVEEYKKYKPEIQTRKAMQYAINKSGKYLAVDRMDIKNKMVEYTQNLITEGLAKNRPAYELVSDFYYQSKEKKSEGIEEWNRDIQRIILTESKTAMEAGKMVEAKEYNDRNRVRTYMMYGSHVNPEEGANEPCNIWLGKIGLVVDDPQDTDRPTGKYKDKHADFLIWAGKTNIGRKKANWWMCVPSHPNCKHSLFSINPELEEFNKKTGGIKFKDVEEKNYFEGK